MIEIKNIGPIAALYLPVPADGGVVVLSGRNGTGKTTALDAIRSAISGKGKPQISDMASAGEVKAGGVKLTVGRNVKRAGLLEVSTLEGKFSVADLVDPGIADPFRADAARIKALVTLSGQSLEKSDLFGFDAEMIDGLDFGDPVAAMAELKKRLDIGAREYEKLAKAEGDKAAALLEVAGEFGDSGDLEECRSVYNRLVAEKNVSDQAKARADAARAKLAQNPPADLAAAVRIEQELAEKELAAREKAIALKAEYNRAAENYQRIKAEHELAKAQAEAASKISDLREQLERQIAESEIAGPSGDQIEDARRAMLDAERSKKSAEDRAKANAMLEESERLAAECATLRRKAQQTQDVLSDIVGALNNCPLRVVDGGLVIDTKRGPTRFAELSHGERWRLSLDIAIAAVGENGLLVIPQEAWEGLDPKNRAAIAAQVKAAGVVVITAECADGPLSSEVFDPAA